MGAGRSTAESAAPEGALDQSGVAAVILAAGKGTRMRSATPKALHAVGGRAMVGHVIDVVDAAFSGGESAPRKVVIVGHEAEAVRASVATLSPDADVALQAEQLGTGHAALMAREALRDFDGDVFVLFVDTPLIEPQTLAAMRAARRSGVGVVVLGFEAAEPGSYGRLIEDGDGALLRIVEAKDADADERAVTLCNSGVMCIDGARLFAWLDRIEATNAKNEYYLTDIVEIARADGADAVVVRCPEAQLLGVNSRVDLAAAEAAFQARARAAAMIDGATLVAPESVFFSHDTRLGEDVLVEPHVVFGPGVTVESGATIRAFSHLEGCVVRSEATVGPYARLRPGADVGQGARVGNFVEVKATRLGPGAKANHLAYLGDAEVGADVNVGAGVITCNYDGFLKHRTEIGDGAFVGSNASLVAPVSVGAGATIAAGSTITTDVPDDALALGRARQVVKPGLAARLRASLKAAKDALRGAGGGGQTP